MSQMATADDENDGTFDDVPLPFDILNDLLVPGEDLLTEGPVEDLYACLAWPVLPGEKALPQPAVTVIPPVAAVQGAAMSSSGTVSPVLAADWGENSDNLATLLAAGNPASTKRNRLRKKMTCAALLGYSAKLHNDNTFKRHAIATATSRMKLLREQVALIWKHEQMHACASAVKSTPLVA